MRRLRLLPVLAVLCFSAFAAPARAETAGQVLAVVGEALALRAGTITRLVAGAGVESGDQIHTGPDSSIQIRFTDWGFVSLRARTDFVVDDYVYEAGRGGRERAFFSLLNGGVRSLTGAIGHRDHSAFRLRATTATVGVRGTHFSLLICKQDCRNPDGSLGEDGLYGQVFDGRIAVSPYGGASLEREFKAGESFRLVNENSIPGPLFSAPPFLPDRLDPQARSGGAPIASVGGVIPGAGSPAANPDPLPAVTGGLATTLVSTLPASGVLVTPLAKQVVLPAADLAGSTVNAVLSMPALGPIMPLAGAALNAVPAVVAPILPAAGSLVNSVVPVLPAPVVPPVTVPGLPPVTVPTLPPVTAPTLPPVTTPTLPPVIAPTLPPVTAPTLPPVTVPTLPLPTAPSLPLSTGAMAPLLRR
jgi:hypothetical protein